jgi:hypothetical protein
MGHIMVDWDDEWKIPPVETGPSEKQNPQVQEIDDDEEEGDDRKEERAQRKQPNRQHHAQIGRGKNQRQGDPYHNGQSTKSIKEVAIQALTEEYLEKIGDQVKEVTDDAFQHATQQQEEMHKHMQEKMVELHQLLEATNIMPG